MIGGVGVLFRKKGFEWKQSGSVEQICIVCCVGVIRFCIVQYCWLNKPVRYRMYLDDFKKDDNAMIEKL